LSISVLSDLSLFVIIIIIIIIINIIIIISSSSTILLSPNLFRVTRLRQDNATPLIT